MLTRSASLSPTSEVPRSQPSKTNVLDDPLSNIDHVLSETFFEVHDVIESLVVKHKLEELQEVEIEDWLASQKLQRLTELQEYVDKRVENLINGISSAKRDLSDNENNRIIRKPEFIQRIKSQCFDTNIERCREILYLKVEEQRDHARIGELRERISATDTFVGIMSVYVEKNFGEVEKLERKIEKSRDKIRKLYRKTVNDGEPARDVEQLGRQNTGSQYFKPKTPAELRIEALREDIATDKTQAQHLAKELLYFKEKFREGESKVRTYKSRISAASGRIDTNIEKRKRLTAQIRANRNWSSQKQDIINEIERQDQRQGREAKAEQVQEKFLSTASIPIKNLGIQARPVSEQAAIISTISRYEATGNIKPVLTADGRLMYPFGLSKPQLICTPFRLSTIELQEGEIMHHVDSGDPVRWNVNANVFTQSGAKQKPVIVVKTNTAEEIETDLVITTNRRTYRIGLKCILEGEYTPHIGFFYPEETTALAPPYNPLGQPQQNVPEKNNSTVITTADINLDYKVTSKSSGWFNSKPAFYPETVFDDGKKVFIKLPGNMPEAPAFFVLDNGNESIVNARLLNDFYIIDRLFDKAILVVGSGRHKNTVVIERR